MDTEGLIRELEPLNLAAPPFTSAKAQAYYRYYGLDLEDRLAGVSHYFGTFGSQGYEIACHYFALAGAAKTCFIYHGYFDHSGLFDHAVEYALTRGYSVVIYDLPGHGLSSGERAVIDSFATYTAVLRDGLALFAAAPKPWLAIGQSTGGAVLMNYLLTDHAPQFQQVVLLAPLLRTVRWQWVRWSYRALRPWLAQVARDFRAGTCDAAFNNFLEHHDPLQCRRIPVRWVGAMLDWEREFQRLPNSDFPLLIVQGLADNTVDARYNPAVIKNKFPHAKILRLGQAGHQLVNERVDIREHVWAAIDLYLQHR